jgi:hypothetical protein
MRKLVRGNLTDVSRSGMGLRVEIPEVASGARLLIRFWTEGRSFTVPGELVWTREDATDHATAGVRLALHRAPNDARRAFQRWARDVERTRPAPGALPPREQVECRIAALSGSLDELLELLASERTLDERALQQVDIAAEALQNAITALELRDRRR